MYVKIIDDDGNETTRTINSEAQRQSALMEMAIVGVDEAQIHDGLGERPGEVLEINGCAALYDILDYARRTAPHVADVMPMARLPKWGALPVLVRRDELLSYDEKHVIVGTRPGNATLMTRDAWELETGNVMTGLTRAEVEQVVLDLLRLKNLWQISGQEIIPADVDDLATTIARNCVACGPNGGNHAARHQMQNALLKRIGLQGGPALTDVQ